MTKIDGRAGDTELEMSVELAASPERVFRALTSAEVTAWWVRPGVFDTREWTGELRPGGRWSASGVSRGQPYVATGEILEIDAPRRLVHTWDGVGAPDSPSTLRYTLEHIPSGTRLRLRQSGFKSPVACREFAAGWETSFARLEEVLSTEPVTATA